LAQDALSKYKLTTPAKENAYAYYQEVLKRDPENRRALEGFSLIADRYLALATKAFNQGQDSNAKRYVELGLWVKHDHPGLLALHDRLTSQKQPVVKSVDRFFRQVKGLFD
jgi:serine/threonine-protein kinase PpkA